MRISYPYNDLYNKLFVLYSKIPNLYSGHALDGEPSFSFQTTFNHRNTGLARYSEPICILSLSRDESLTQ